MRRAAPLFALLTLAASLVAAAPARADHLLLSCAMGSAFGHGVIEHRVLHDELYIPEHDDECAGTSGPITFDLASDVDAIEDFQNRRTMFLGLNAPLRAEEWAVAVSSRNNPGPRTSTLHHLPLFIGGFAVTTNLGSCAGLLPGPVKLGPISLSLIYSGVATTWGDPSIVRDNPALVTCTERIEVSVRDGSEWSTSVLKDYMSKRSPAFAAYKQRELLPAWPPSLRIGCRAFDDSGMRLCGQHAGSISYMPYKTAKLAGLSVALMENGANGVPQFVHPAANPTDTWPSNCPSAVPTGVAFPQTLADWSNFSMTYASTGYPVCAFSYTIAFQTPNAANNAWADFQTRNLKDHLIVMVSEDMQAALPARGYAPLPTTAINTVRNSVNSIVIPNT